MNKILTTIIASAITLGASAQVAPSRVNLNNNYKGKLGLQHVRNLSDAQIQSITEHFHAMPLPTKAETAKMLKKALAQRTSMAKGVKSSSIVERFSAANYAASDTLMAESWESWIIDVNEGTTQGFNWRPATWLHKSNFDAEKYISEARYDCPTWMCYQTDGYYVPYATDGDAVLLCMAGNDVLGSDGQTVIAPAPEQDEWIASPVVSSVQATNYISFDLAYTPLYTHLFAKEGGKIDITRIAYDVEVLVTTSTRSTTIDPANYTCLFKLSDIVAEMFKGVDVNDPKELTTLEALRWQHFKISLADYAGKNIRVAFRYKGIMAGNVMLDAVRVSDMLPVAMYDKPDGSFYFGFSTDARLSMTKNALIPAYKQVKWTNYSNQDSDSFVWNYEVNGEKGESTEKDLIMSSVNPGTIYWPTLESISGIRSDKYFGATDMNGDGLLQPTEAGTAKVGGDGVITYPDATQGQIQVDFGLGNFDATKLYWLGELTNGGDVFAFGTGSSSFWAAMTDYAYNAVSGIANFFDKPASTYVFNRVTLPLGAWESWGASLVCTVYKAVELPGGGLAITDEVLGQTSVNQADYIPTSKGYILSFNFPNVMEVNDPICISITGIDNDMLMKFAPITQALNHDSDMGYAFVILKNQSTGNQWWCEIAGALKALEQAGNMQVSHAIGMNAIFPYLHSNDGDVFDASVNGETKAFDIESYWYPEKKDAQSLDGWDIQCPESWIKVEKTLDVDAQKAGIVITADPLPAGVDGRATRVTIKATGCEETITVIQGNATGINSTISNVLSRTNGAFTISGQRVNSKNAKSGLFIVKKGNKYVKEIRK